MTAVKQPEPILVSHLFPELLDSLLALLSGLAAGEWEQPTVCEGWSVRDVTLHLLGVEVGILSRKRDRFSLSAAPVRDLDELVALINDLNATWVRATRRISPRLLCDLLEFTGRQVCEYFASLDPYALGGPVSWASPDPAPVWLDLAREYTERWHHQQHIRDAIGKPGLTEPRFLAPVLQAFVRALPQTFRHVGGADGTLVAFTVTGRAGGQWFLLKEQDRWGLYVDVPGEPEAQVVVDEDTAWRLLTKGLDRTEARARTTLLGDQSLGLKVLDTVSILA